MLGCPCRRHVVQPKHPSCQTAGSDFVSAEMTQVRIFSSRRPRPPAPHEPQTSHRPVRDRLLFVWAVLPLDAPPEGVALFSTGVTANFDHVEVCPGP